MGILRSRSEGSGQSYGKSRRNGPPSSGLSTSQLSPAFRGAEAEVVSPDDGDAQLRFKRFQA